MERAENWSFKRFRTSSQVMWITRPVVGLVLVFLSLRRLCGICVDIFVDGNVVSFLVGREVGALSPLLRFLWRGRFVIRSCRWYLLFCMFD